MKNPVKSLISGPIIKGVEEDLAKTTIRIWGKAKVKSNGDAYLVGRISRLDDVDYSQTVSLRVEAKHDGIGILQFDDLEPATTYLYQLGYVTGTIDDLVWGAAPTGRFETAGDNDIWNFCFGSCRLHAKVGPLTLFGSGSSADKIYRVIQERRPQFFLEIGDQVYFDYLGTIGRATTVDTMRSRYRVRDFPHQKHLYANLPIYSMCDDHDLHRNNTDYKKRQSEPEVWKNGLQVFREYQSLRGPTFHGPLWYSFARYNATFFVCDSRSERRNGSIISEEQMNAINDWVTHPEHDTMYKFFVSPTPVVSQDSDDAWFGYPKQQRQLIEILLQSSDVYILTGDAHCARTGVYQIHNEAGDMNRQVIEILSSGLSAAACDRGKGFDRAGNVMPADYDEKNDFPSVLDNTKAGGLRFVTNYSTECFPKKHTSLVKHLTKGNLDHIVTDVLITEHSLHVNVINHKSEILHTLVLNRGQYV